jgi:hypothetical protein
MAPTGHHSTHQEAHMSEEFQDTRLDEQPRESWESSPPERIVKALFEPGVAFAFLAWVAAYHPQLLHMAVNLKRFIA